MVKGLMERLMVEERAMYPKEHPTKAKRVLHPGSSDPVRPHRGSAGTPGAGERFPAGDPPRAKKSFVGTLRGIFPFTLPGPAPGIFRFLKVIYGAFHSPQSISRLTQVVEEEAKAWRERPLSPEYYAIYLDGTFLHIRRGQTAKEPVYLALGILPDGRREILGFWLFCTEGESTENWEEVLKESQAAWG